jgi:serine/threonine protein kinase
MPEAPRSHPSPRQLADFSLGKLPAEDLSWVVAHLAACPRCRGKVEGPAARGGTVLPSCSPAPRLDLGGKPPAAAAAPADVPAELAGSSKYQVLGKFGQGGMGSVWKAKHTFFDCLVAIKVLNPEVVGQPDIQARFLQEMKAAGQLQHRHIVRALDADQVGGLLILVMEYVEGVTLDRLVQQKGALPVRFACRCAVQAAEGLQHAHERGLAHRDVKPANLIVTGREKEVKVLDFGLPRLPRGREAKGNQTQFQTFMGTPEYVAPEQATDARCADIRSDVYSRGCTLYFLLAGAPPFRGNTLFETVTANIQDDPRPLTEVRPEVPAALWAVVAKMMAKRPGERFQTPGEVAEALRPFAAPAAGAATPPPSLSRVVPPPLPQPGPWHADTVTRWLLGALLGGLLLLAMVAAAIMFKSRAPRARPQQEPEAAAKPQPEPAIAKAEQRPAPAAVVPTAEKKPPPPTPSLSLATVDRVLLSPGKSHDVKVAVKRENCRSEVEVLLNGLPGGVTAARAIIPADGDSATLTLRAAAGAAEGERQARVVARAGAVRTEGRLLVAVEHEVGVIGRLRHPGFALAVALSGNGSRALSGGVDGMVRLWDADTGKFLRLFRGDSGWVRSVALSGNGRRALSGGYEGTVLVWNLPK